MRVRAQVEHDLWRAFWNRGQRPPTLGRKSQCPSAVRVSAKGASTSNAAQVPTTFPSRSAASHWPRTPRHRPSRRPRRSHPRPPPPSSHQHRFLLPLLQSWRSRCPLQMDPTLASVARWPTRTLPHPRKATQLPRLPILWRPSLRRSLLRRSQRRRALRLLRPPLCSHDHRAR